jgi:hypothetical protein
MYHITNRGYRGILELSYQKPRMARDIRIIISQTVVGDGLQKYHITNCGYRGTLELPYHKPRLERDFTCIISQTAVIDGLQNYHITNLDGEGLHSHHITNDGWGGTSELSFHSLLSTFFLFSAFTGLTLGTANACTIQDCGKYYTELKQETTGLYNARHSTGNLCVCTQPPAKRAQV